MGLKPYYTQRYYIYSLFHMSSGPLYGEIDERKKETQHRYTFVFEYFLSLESRSSLNFRITESYLKKTKQKQNFKQYE